MGCLVGKIFKYIPTINQIQLYIDHYNCIQIRINIHIYYYHGLLHSHEFKQKSIHKYSIFMKAQKLNR